jgi:hypothetical protein
MPVFDGIDLLVKNAGIGPDRILQTESVRLFEGGTGQIWWNTANGIARALSSAM